MWCPLYRIQIERLARYWQWWLFPLYQCQEAELNGFDANAVSRMENRLLQLKKSITSISDLLWLADAEDENNCYVFVLWWCSSKSRFLDRLPYSSCTKLAWPSTSLATTKSYLGKAYCATLHDWSKGQKPQPLYLAWSMSMIQWISLWVI